MNSGLKNRIIKWGWITSRVPFLNKVSMKKNLLKSKGILISCNIDCVGIDNEIVIEPGCILRNCHLHIQGNHNKIHLAENVRASCMEIWIEDNTNTVTVGGETAFCGKIHIACTEGTTISIGNDCLFSQEIVIRSGDSHPIFNEHRQRINSAESIEIGNHVWVGYRAMILKGVTIPQGCVVGTGAIVTKPIEQGNVVLAGIPASIVKERIEWKSDRRTNK